METQDKIAYFCDPSQIEVNAAEQLSAFVERGIDDISVFPDIHYCSEKNLPVGVAFATEGRFYPLVTGKDMGCGVMFLRISKKDYIKPFDKEEHYRAFDKASYTMTDDGLGGGNHFLSIEDGDDGNLYIICHTGSRNLGIAMYQKFLRLIDDNNFEHGTAGDVSLPRSAMTDELLKQYNSVLDFAANRRKEFVFGTLSFLQHNGYVKTGNSDSSKLVFKNLPTSGLFNTVNYEIRDSMHNHIRFEHPTRTIHRKGSTELWLNNEVVIPLSMTRGSLIVMPHKRMSDMLLAANFSCSHGAGRKLSRMDCMKHWRSGMKKSERQDYDRFPELLDRNGEFPKGYIQEFDFAYKDSDDILSSQPYLQRVAKTTPIATVKFTEI